jgi:hypothetical protein
MAVSCKGAHFPQDIILTSVRWYVAYPLSYRHVEELREERGVSVDHATIQRWVVKYSPQLEEACQTVSSFLQGGVEPVVDARRAAGGARPSGLPRGQRDSDQDQRHGRPRTRKPTKLKMSRASSLP